MKRFLIAGVVLASSITGAVADLCADGSTDDAGNWYCQQVNAVSYTGLDGSGSYQKVTNMDADTGACEQTSQGYSGSMSPLDEELSLHFRGPLQLLKFAAYSSGAAPSKKKHRRRSVHHHGHQHLHEHKRNAHAIEQAVEKRQAECSMVTATINGAVQSWMNNYLCTPAADAGSGGSSPATTAAEVSSTPASTAAASSATSSVSSQSNSGYIGSSSASESSASGSWGQVAYYDASSGTKAGLTFLNHMGGTAGSGTWSTTFGNSLSYASSDGCSGASSPQTLSNTQLPSTAEVVIMTDQECSGTDDCGYYLNGTTAYHGFEGPEKAFYFQFTMPDVPADDSSNGNMPAIWALNAQIPRTAQYAENQQCSCWASGCGEIDIFEVLAPGDSRAKSTLHGNSPCNGGDSDYFARPTDSNSPITVGVVMLGGNIHIQVMDDFDFSDSVPASNINTMTKSLMSQGNGVSVFALAQ